MKEIQLTRGYIALVDDEDFERVNQYKWQSIICTHTVYAKRGDYSSGKNKTNLMHNFIMRVENSRKNGIEVDHKNHNGLDNQKKNLRICTHNENNMNRSSNKNSTSIYRGVSWCKVRNKWISLIYFNKKRIHLGRFNSEFEAAKVYDKKAAELFGEFANLNIK